MGILIGVAATALGVALIILLAGSLIPSRGGPGRPRRTRKQERGKTPLPLPRLCPLCSCELGAGERVKSDILRGKSDALMRIYGCPHCWPPLPGSPDRFCPVCATALPAQGHAIARYFESPGRKHVHVLGCTQCRTTSPRRP